MKAYLPVEKVICPDCEGAPVDDAGNICRTCEGEVKIELKSSKDDLDDLSKSDLFAAGSRFAQRLKAADDEATVLLESLLKRFGTPKYFEMEPETAGKISQISNLLAGLSGETFVWRSMDSAPTDGTRVLCCFCKGETPEVLYFSGGMWYSELEREGQTSFIFQPTHWMPLPGLPAEKASEP